MARLGLIVAGALIAAGCTQQASNQQLANEGSAAVNANANAVTPKGEGFSYPIIDRARKTIGHVDWRPDAGGVRLTVEVRELPPGLHGMHIHEVGKCDPPSFGSSGTHWNWNQKRHGHQNPAGHHAGDLGNLSVAADGTGHADLLISREDWNPMMDRGLSLIIHADRDDERTDPEGNSGERIACGLVFPSPH